MLLVGDGVPVETVETIARRLNVRMRTDSQRPPAPDGTPVVTLACGDRLAEVISAGAAFGLEPGISAPWPERLRDVIAAADNLLFAWCITSSTGYSTPVVDAMTQHLTETGALPEDLMWGFRLAITEAIANACIHGNMEIDGEDRLHPERFIKFVELVEGRLADPAYARRGLMLSVRRVDVGLHAEVWQETGQMPVPPPIPARLEENQMAAGRGFALMGASALRVEISEDRKRVGLVFAA